MPDEVRYFLENARKAHIRFMDPTSDTSSQLRLAMLSCFIDCMRVSMNMCICVCVFAWVHVCLCVNEYVCACMYVHVCV